MAFAIKVNGNTHSVDVDGDTPLLWVLRAVLGMTGTKFGCGMALCGACTVHIDGAPARSCITSIDSIGSAEIATIEAIGASAAGARIQKAWLDLEVVQCGYCQSGQIMSASALIASNQHPTDSDIDAAMSGNIGRCGTCAFVRRSSRLRNRAHRESEHDPRSYLIRPLGPRPTGISKQHLPAQVFAGWSERQRRPDAEFEPAIRQR
jgi:isoquinoline 1-oxidoreductase alpha subunit